MTIEEEYMTLYNTYQVLFDYENWRNTEMRMGYLSIEDFNSLPPYQLVKMYSEWVKNGRWEYGSYPMSN